MANSPEPVPRVLVDGRYRDPGGSVGMARWHLRSVEGHRTHEERVEAYLAAQTWALLAIAEGKLHRVGAIPDESLDASKHAGDAATVAAGSLAGPDRLLSIEQVSEMTKVPVATLRYYRATEKGPRSFKVGGRLRYKESDVELWVEQARAGGVN